MKLSTTANNGSFIGAPTTNVPATNNNGLININSHTMTGGKLKLLVQKPCFKLIVGAVALCGVVAYSVFANMCYYNCLLYTSDAADE